MLRSKESVRAYWTTALQLLPDLRCELVSILVWVESITLAYKGYRGLGAEVFHLGPDRKVLRVSAHSRYR